MRQRQPPDIRAILGTLSEYELSYVLVGSVAVQAWGVEIGTPGDVDIVPDASRDNLVRLSTALDAMDAESWPVTGRWRIDERGEREWENLAKDHPDYLSRLPVPDPGDVGSYDSMYSTRHGDLDVVPTLTGTYEELSPASVPLEVHGVNGVQVIGVASLLSRLTVPRRAKDAGRVDALRAIQRGNPR